MRVALITGITGQDGSYLAELLLEKGYEVFGIIRRSSSFNTKRIDHIFDKLHLRHGDITDTACLISILTEMKKFNAEQYEIYNLSGQSHVKVSFEVPEYTGQVNAMGVLNLLEAIRTILPEARLYQASTSEMYGLVQEVPQTEKTPFYPRSPYGVAKLYAFWIVKNYREAYNLFACNGILYNHESPRRGETFVTRKITKAVSAIYSGKQECLFLGNLDARRDWGHAKDYVKAMWMMLQHDTPDDYIVATGKQYSVRDFVEEAFKYIGIKLRWEGTGTEEIGIDESNNVRVRVDSKYFRPTEVESLLGCPTKINKTLGWIPDISIDELVSEMMSADLRATKN